MAYQGQRRIAYNAGFQDALYGRPSDNPYSLPDQRAAYDEGYADGAISDTPPRGPKGDTGDPGPAGPSGAPGSDGTDGADGSRLYVGAGAPSNGLGNDNDQYIDTDNGDIYTKVAGSWSLQGNVGAVALTTRTDVVDPDATPEIIYRGRALPGTAENVASWRIERITIQSDEDVEILFADGNDAFDNIWNNRASLSYS